MCMLLKSKPLMTAPYQTDDFVPILTFPITDAELATNDAFICGTCEPNLTALVDGNTNLI